MFGRINSLADKAKAIAGNALTEITCALEEAANPIYEDDELRGGDDDELKKLDKKRTILVENNRLSSGDEDSSRALAQTPPEVKCGAPMHLSNSLAHNDMMISVMALIKALTLKDSIIEDKEFFIEKFDGILKTLTLDAFKLRIILAKLLKNNRNSADASESLLHAASEFLESTNLLEAFQAEELRHESEIVKFSEILIEKDKMVCLLQHQLSVKDDLIKASETIVDKYKSDLNVSHIEFNRLKSSLSKLVDERATAALTRDSQDLIDASVVRSLVSQLRKHERNDVLYFKTFQVLEDVLGIDSDGSGNRKGLANTFYEFLSDQAS